MTRIFEETNGEEIMSTPEKQVREKRWWTIRPKIMIYVGIAIFVAVLLSTADPHYSLRLKGTHLQLRFARDNIKDFKEITGRNPHSLSEVDQYVKGDPNSFPSLIKFAEFISDAHGNQHQYNTLNGQGGFFYNSETGEVKINLTKPVKHYLWLYFGKERNEIPSEW